MLRLKRLKLLKRSKVNALMLLCLVLFLTACASSPLPVVVTKIEKQYPPLVLMQSYDSPALSGETWRDVAVMAAKQKAVIKKYQLNMKLLKDWSSPSP